MGDVVHRPALTRIVIDDAAGVEIASREAVRRKIELALPDVPSDMRRYIGDALLERALLDCRRRLKG